MIDEERLRNALLEMQEYQVSLYPVPTKEDSRLPLGFRIKMDRLIEKHDHPVWFYVRRAAVIMLFVLGVSGILFGFGENVRADIIKWISEHFTENEYRYQKETETGVDVSRYTLEEKVPEGYRLVKRKEETERVSELYTGESGEQIIFTAMSSTLNKEFYLMFDKNVECETVYVNDIKAELYLAESADDNIVIVWQGNDGALFSITGFLDKDVLIDLAGAVAKEDLKKLD